MTNNKYKLLLVIFTVLLQGCIFSQKNLCTTNPDISKQNLDGFSDKKEVLAEAALYSVFSAIAYEDSGLGMYKLPKGWRRDKSKPDPSGLFIATFKNDEQKQLVIAFRGTELDDSADWIQNLLPFVRIQSAPALDYTKNIMMDNPGWKISLTGHSLGGGLAIEMSHKLDNVLAVAFNPSPRIGITRNGESNRRIAVREKHEPLAIVRGNPSVRANWDLDREALVDFTSGFFGQRFLKQHSIDTMALNLLALTSKWNNESRQLHVLICDSQF